MQQRSCKKVLVASFLLISSAAHAQAIRTWVSGVGDDANPCSRTAPCKTFSGAIIKTAAGGEISVLDPGGFGSVTITKSIVINGRGVVTGITGGGTNGISISNSSGSPISVILRDLDLIATAGLNGIRVIGSTSPTSIQIENTRISGFTTAGIGIAPGVGGNVKVMAKNLAISDCGSGPGVDADATNAPVSVVLDHVTSANCEIGLKVAGGAKAIARSSDFSHNTTGVAVTGTSSVANLDSGNIAFCTTAVSVLSAGATARLTNMTVMDNVTGLSNAGGTIVTFNNNRVRNNTTNGFPNAIQTQN
jgi:hypothetical protein